MRRLTLFFFVLALCALPIGFGALDPALGDYARVVFFGALVVAVGLLAGAPRSKGQRRAGRTREA